MCFGNTFMKNVLINGTVLPDKKQKAENNSPVSLEGKIFNEIKTFSSFSFIAIKIIPGISYKTIKIKPAIKYHLRQQQCHWRRAYDINQNEKTKTLLMINILNAHTNGFNTLQTSREYFNKTCDTQENQRKTKTNCKKLKKNKNLPRPESL